MPRSDDILAGIQDQRLILQDYVPLADSLDWRLGARYWHRTGVNAFLADEVPTRIISDGNLSAGMAETFFTSLLAVESNGESDDEITVLEIGAGAGLFARYFLDEFRTICRDYRKSFYDRLRYVLTDSSQKMLDDIARLNVLSEHRGRYDLRLATAPSFGLPDGTRVHWVVCNYVLDSLPAAIVRVEGERSSLLCVRTSLDRGYVPVDPSAPTPDEIRRLACAGELDSLIDLYPYFSVNHRFELLDADALPCLDELAASAEEGQTVLMHNYGAIACLHNAIELLHTGGCIQVADYAPPRYNDAVNLLHRWEHYGGSTCLGVNFPLLGRHFSEAGLEWIEPDGSNGLIELRLLSRGIAPSAAAFFRRRFGAAAFGWRSESVIRARKLIAANNPEAALASFRQALSRQPRNWALLEETARFLLTLFRDPVSALAMAEEALAINPIHPPLHVLRAECLLQQGLLNETLDSARRALDLDPANVNALLAMVRAYHRGSRYPEALAMIAAALAIDGGRDCRDPLLAEQQAILDILARRAARRARTDDRFAGETD